MAEGQDARGREHVSRVATELYTASYLILFSILGTLARLGLQWLTFYPGAPVSFSELWANVGGTLVMGFLGEDRKLFAQEWGKETAAEVGRELTDEEKALEGVAAKASHAKVKKTIPLYIGLATGFCGSFTSFSSFMRDTFLSLSNDLPSPINHPYPPGAPISTSSTVARHGGYSFMAVVAVIATTIALCYAALRVGIHLANYIDRFTPTLPFHFFRRFIDPLFVLIAWGAWIGAIIMAVFPPDRPSGPASKGSTWSHETWRGEAIFACVFSPPGALLRYYASLKLNTIVPSFPLGTFAVNIFGTAVLGMGYDLQHVRIGSALTGGGRVGCQVLQGVMDGFCGCLTTVSTWIAEINSLPRGKSWVYAACSVGVGLSTMVVIMGSVKWTVGFSAPACVT
ncbi:hypothetical protein BU24DRAFT_354901 [Aaosphaeria arxii CBS 175.79]|uniref:CrcB-like protein-domain-containing protein n=1 Tax=Aaosphaeria arxii CBS 175.79 TaxID=1450172 RepID=A0A6A5XED8_9PLEO|nr:uncharacterized protein BU24DRAFT_354901 [Aaosphaeria arxii CBS 175.79]KAF2011422.1 hypothetical protein BU24DRAFT_354901 [Aaosphaeria arxii CBS 175.79]